MNAFQNYLILKTDTLFESHTKFKGVNGENLVLDPSFDPQKHTRIYGEVVSTPLYLTKRPISQETIGTPAYGDRSPFVYRYLSDIEMDVQVGDRVYYHFNSLQQRNFVKVDGRHPNRTWYFKVSYDQISCIVRDKQIIPIGSYVLCDPDFEEWSDILIETFTNLKDKEGNFIPKPKDQWIQTKVKPEHKFLTAFVRHVGKPFKGDKCEVKVGQKIWYRRNADWINKIEDRDYFVIRQRHIIGREVDGKFVPNRNYMLVIPEEEPEQTKSGIYIKKKLTRKGVVFHPGNSSYEEGLRVMFGESDRQELTLEGKKYLLIKKEDVFATWVN